MKKYIKQGKITKINLEVDKLLNENIEIEDQIVTKQTIIRGK